jgi:hypothetical protein
LDWPLAIRRYLTAELLRRMLEQHNGWQGLVRWLYAGAVRNGERLPFSPSMDFLWPFVEEDAAAWEQERAKASSASEAPR